MNLHKAGREQPRPKHRREVLPSVVGIRRRWNYRTCLALRPLGWPGVAILGCTVEGSKRIGTVLPRELWVARAPEIYALGQMLPTLMTVGDVACAVMERLLVQMLFCTTAWQKPKHHFFVIKKKVGTRVDGVTGPFPNCTIAGGLADWQVSKRETGPRTESIKNDAKEEHRHQYF